MSGAVPRMNVLIVNRALGTLFGGGESFDLSAARHLKKRGHKVTIITAKPLLGPPAHMFADVDIIYLPCPNLRRIAYRTEKFSSRVSAAFYHLDNLIFERKVLGWFSRLSPGAFDIVQCCSLFGLPERLISRFGQAVVSWLPGPPSGMARGKIRRLLRERGFRLFLHGTSESALASMGYRRDEDFAVIEPGIEIERVDNAGDRGDARRALGLDGSALIGATTARLVPVKNHSLLLEAIASAKAKGVTWRWIIIGNGPSERELKAKVAALGLESEVHFLGYRSPDDVHRCLAAADLFALTSTYESYSIATLEAMAHRLPVVCSKVGFMERLVNESGAGVLVPADGSDRLADVLVEMAEDRVRSTFGEKGRKFAEIRDWPRIAEQLETLYVGIERSANDVHS